MSSAGIAFTLPISCQICLGKVKQPIVCPNQHVFCSPCMDVWLQRSQHCPACRTPIDEQNPCKKILGGLSQETDVKEDFSKNKELRRARADVLFKEYEEEFERLQNEMETLKHENKVLAEQLKYFRNSRGDEVAGQPIKEDHPDVDTMLNLTKKLQETMASYEKAKKDKDRVKKENNYLKDENVNLGRENQQLRMELTSRSPRKYGRLAAAAMETKLESYEKENKLLQKALERSDLYVDEMEKELNRHKKFVKLYSKCPQCDAALVLKDASDAEDKLCKGDADDLLGKVPVIKLLQRAASWPAAPNVAEGEQGKALISGTSFYGKKPTPVKSKSSSSATQAGHKLLDSWKVSGSQTPKKQEDSFGLEHPSPVTPSTVLRKLAINDSDSSRLENSSLNACDATSSSATLENTDSYSNAFENSSSESCRKKLRFDAGQDSDLFSRPSTSGFLSDSRNSTLESGLNLEETVSSSKQKHVSKAHKSKGEATFELPSSTSESDDHDEGDHNMTSDIAECMELLDRAERKVSQQKFQTPMTTVQNLKLHNMTWKVPSVPNTTNTDAKLRMEYARSTIPAATEIRNNGPVLHPSSSGLSAASSALPSWYTGSAPRTDSYKPSGLGISSSAAGSVVTCSSKPNVSQFTDSGCNQLQHSSSYRQVPNDVRPQKSLNHLAQSTRPVFGSYLSQNTMTSSGVTSGDYNLLSKPVNTLSQPVSTSSNVFYGAK